MKTRRAFDAYPAIIVFNAALCLLLLCSGCLRHNKSTTLTYRVEELEGMPMLLPSVTQADDLGQFQTATIILPLGHAESGRAARQDCEIEGAVFSLHPSPGADKHSWIVRAPSASGWASLSSSTDIHAQWRSFLRELARLDETGCFASGVTSRSLRVAIAQSIPLPAIDVVDSVYSDQGDRYVDLAPGMQIKIQGILSTASSGDAQSGKTTQMWTVAYDVVHDHDGGVRLKEERTAENRRELSRPKDRNLLTLDQRFLHTPILRLFLQGFSEKESETGALLIGASRAAKLEVLTDGIRQTSPARCVALQGSACIELPSGSVSLISFIWINGHRMPAPFGTPLASLVYQMPQSEREKALRSAQVSRQLSTGHLAAIEFTHTMEGARQLLLLPGDRVEWKTE